MADHSRNIAYFFWNGGPRSVSLGYFVVIAGVLAQVASMAEMVSPPQQNFEAPRDQRPLCVIELLT